MEMIQEATDCGYAEGKRAGTAAIQKIALEALRQIVPEIVARADEENIEDAQARIDRILQQVPPGPRRDALMVQLRKVFHKEQIRLQREIAATRTRRNRIADHLQHGVEHLEKLVEWDAGPLRLQRPTGSLLAEFCDALQEERVVDVRAKHCFASPDQIAAWTELAQSASVYVVQHDWASAFRNVRDYVDGEIKLPDDACAFEFRISDRHVIAFATEVDGALYLQLAVQVRKGWVLFPVDQQQSADCGS